MDVVNGLAALTPGRGPAVVTIGVFDGVHRGHQAVLERTLEVARSSDLGSVAVTFDRHPREVLTPGDAPPLITTRDRKARMIAALGIDTLMVLPFDDELAGWEAEVFARKVVVDALDARHVVVGANFVFGHRASGSVQTLQAIGADDGFEAEGVPLLRLAGRTVSSTAIRAAVGQGELGWPTEALGRPFAVDGRVVAGAGRGAGLGYPTANLEVPRRMLIPGRGAYAGRAVLADGSLFAAAINVGTNPTFGEEPLHVEAFLLDFAGDLRGREISVEFWQRLHDEVRFESAEALIHQIDQDVARTRILVAERALG